MMHWYGDGMYAVVWLFMGLFWLVILGLAVVLVVRLMSTGGATRWRSGERPLDILDRRFARGEVDLETYQAQRTALEAAADRSQRR